MQERLSKFMYDMQMMAKMQPFAAINYIRHGIGYEDYLNTYASERHLDANELLEILNELQESSKNYRTFTEWFQHIEDYTEQLKQQARRQREAASDAVSLATMHHSKGLEYEIVFIVDANENVIPHQKALLDTDIEEERRMFYVAMTRAKSRLHIYFVKERYGRPLEMSRFVGEILVDREAIHAGTRVNHKTWGDGTITAVNDRMMTIRFDKTKAVKKLDIQFCLSNQMLKIIEQGDA
jgi:DNA helicase-2/ATP-dependent DNA helicase PcrA